MGIRGSFLGETRPGRDFGGVKGGVISRSLHLEVLALGGFSSVSSLGKVSSCTSHCES
jgi:hypothetical protein